jgi:hypothetical protein
MRRAILHELLQPLDPGEPPPAFRLQAYPILLSGRTPSGDAPAIGKELRRKHGRGPAFLLGDNRQCCQCITQAAEVGGSWMLDLPGAYAQ